MKTVLNLTRCASSSLFFACCFLLSGPTVAWSQTGAAGTIIGRVSNVATGVVLEGATVRVEGSQVSAVTAKDGSYRIQLPAGAHTLVASYTGLDPERVPVTVGAGETVTRDFDLTSAIYELSEFVVASEREGNALAITLQRQAPNVKNVISADAFGSLAGNPADLLERVTGITVNRVGGDIRFIQIRGINENLNSVQVDGNRVASISDARSFQFQNIGSDHIESMEVVKAPTPDMDADAIGGSVNLRSRSAFDLTGRRISYSLGGIRSGQREMIDIMRPAVSLSFSDVFSVLGGNRNLGVSFSAGFRQHLSAIDGMARQYQQVDTSPAYTWQFNFRDFENTRTRYGGGLKLDYKLSDTSMAFANFTYAPHRENEFARIFQVETARAVAAIDPATGQPTGTNPILPGWTDDFTETRPVNNSFTSINDNHRERRARAWTAQLGGRITKPQYNLDYDVSRSYARNRQFNHIVTAQVRGTGWQLDGSDRPRWTPRITWTSGPDVFNLDNYTQNQLQHTWTPTLNEINGAQVNFRKNFDATLPVQLKAGVRLREETLNRWNNSRRWSYVGPDGVMGTADDRLSQFQDMNYNYSPWNGLYPVKPSVKVQDMRASKDNDPHLWTEDVPYRIQQGLQGRQTIRENVSAAYAMGNTQWRRFSLLAGVRMEDTRVKGEGPLRQVTPEESARRAAWPVGVPLTDEERFRRIEEEFKGRRTSSRDYRNYFPGAHLKYEPLDGVIVRTSFSTGIGRPNFSTIIPNDNANYETEVITANNTGLKPQYSDNYDVSVEYYFEPVGLLSAGAFRKEIKDFIFSTGGIIVPEGNDNGFDGLYAGWELRSQANGGFARVKGWEANYQQQFSFLPGAWGGFGFLANYTWLDTYGDYGSIGNVRRTGQLAGFVPRAGNVGISYIRGKINLRLHYAHNSNRLTSFNNADNLKQWRPGENRVDVKFKYIFGKNLDFYFDAYNIFNDKQRTVAGVFDRPRAMSYRNDPQLHFGINGRF